MSYIFAGRSDGVVLLSDDDGQTWDAVYTHGAEVRSLASLGSSVFAAVGASVLRSDDNGANWTTVYSYAGTSPYVWKVLSLNDTLFALCADGSVSYQGALARSANGTDWTEVLAPTPGLGLPVGMDYASGTYYAAFQECDDSAYPDDKASQVWSSADGISWARLGQTNAFNFLSYTYHAGAHWSGRSSYGIYTSGDASAWSLVASTPTSAELWDDGVTMFASAGYLYRSVDNGATWTVESTDGSFLNRAVCKTLAGTFLAASDAGIIRSTDGGDSWTSVHGESTTALATTIFAIGSGRWTMMAVL